MSRTSRHKQHTEYPPLQIPSAGINAGLGGKPSQAQARPLYAHVCQVSAVVR